MKYFSDKIIQPYINESKYYSICEIGAEFGKHTDKLLSLKQASLTVIDPSLTSKVYEKYDQYLKSGQLKIYVDLSLNVLKTLSDPFDCILLDGDHNWYTVYNELKTIEEKGLIKQGGTIFLHDVCWPYGRRDLYYQPETIPSEYRHPYAQKGMIRGQSELAESGKNALLCNALHEGGAKNGVLTAVEDFLKEYGEQYSFFYIEEEWGLGILLKSNNILSNSAFTKCYLKYSIKEQIKHKFPPFYQLLKTYVKS